MPTVKLRGHHFLCILCYRGEGYTAGFVKNFDGMVERINKGATIEIVLGIDDVCAALHQSGAMACEHAEVCRQESVNRRDKSALQDIANVLQKSMESGDTLALMKNDINHLRQLFAQGAIRQACADCPWFEFCSQIAAEDFSGVRLFP